MATVGRGDGLRQAAFGLLLMAAGVALLLEQQGMMDLGSLAGWWPLALVLLGLWKLTAPRERRDVPGGIEWILWGVWVLACTRHWMGLTFSNSWPLIFVAIGVKMIVKALLGQPWIEVAVEYGKVAAPEERGDAAGGKEQGHA